MSNAADIHRNAALTAGWKPVTNQFTNRWIFDSKMRSWTEVMLPVVAIIGIGIGVAIAVAIGFCRLTQPIAISIPIPIPMDMLFPSLFDTAKCQPT
jgi:hypothetical protein